MDQLWSDCVPTDILRTILSRLFGRDSLAFRAVCKRWRFIELLPFHSPRLMILHEETGTVEFFHPLYNELTYKMDLPELIGSRIRCSKDGWLLMSRDEYDMFFFNPFTKVQIELPDLDETNICHAWTFSCPPDTLSTDCFVVGLDMLGRPSVNIIKVGESEWTFYDSFDIQGRFWTSGCNSAVFSNNDTIYLLGDEGYLGILNIKNTTTEKPTWEFCWKRLPRRIRNSIQNIRVAEDADNGGILAIFMTGEKGKLEVWRYKYNKNQKVLETEQVTNLGNKTLFVSRETSYLKPCVAPGLENKIYVSMFDQNNNVVSYNLADDNFYFIDYFANKSFLGGDCFNFVQPSSCIWIDPDVNHLPSVMIQAKND